MNSIHVLETALNKVINKQNLSRKEMNRVMKIILSGKGGLGNDTSFGALLAAIMLKGATVDEVVGMMDIVLNYNRIVVTPNIIEPIVGIIGSGKDSLKTFNVSTAAGIIAAGAELYVAKNGARRESSIAGTTDVLEELGVDFKIPPAKMQKSLEKLHFGLFDVEIYNPKMFRYYVGKFYFFHPLSYLLSIDSAVCFKHMVFGLSNPNTEFTVNCLKELGFKRALVVCGYNQDRSKIFDEISNVGTTKVSELKNGKITTYELTPELLGLDISSEDGIVQGKSIKENADILYAVLSGKATQAQEDIVVANAGALFYLTDKSKNIKEGIKIARASIHNGKAITTLQNFIDFTKRVS